MNTMIMGWVGDLHFKINPSACVVLMITKAVGGQATEKDLGSE